MLRKPLILAVDDQQALRMMLRTMLSIKGFRVLMSATGEDALRICKSFARPIDMLITDVELPELSGFDLGELVTHLRPAMPVLFISGGFNAQDHDVEERLAPGRGFLEKPFSIDQLTSKVNSLLAAPQRLGWPATDHISLQN